MSNAVERKQTADIAVPQPGVVSQATAVEQARAVAEVQAAVLVAQQVPRDVDRALAAMRDSCGRLGLANRAFYSVPNRGTGPTVHLARELARIWGNIDYGVHELRRDDEAGMSEVRAFAWDQQTNVRSTRTFQVPHARMARGKREPLVDLQDVYLTNQNIGARAVRECIFTVLPTWYVEEAQDLARETLKNGEGVPMRDRIATAVDKFAGIDISLEQLEKHVGRKRDRWTPDDLAQLAITYTSITREGVNKDDVFPEQTVTPNEITKRGKAKASGVSAEAAAHHAATGEAVEPDMPDPADGDDPWSKS